MLRKAQYNCKGCTGTAVEMDVLKTNVHSNSIGPYYANLYIRENTVDIIMLNQ